MPSFIQRLVGRAKRRGRGQKARRTEALYDAALRLLAKHDYETITIATIAREAGCSVGAFYGRFRDKEAFLQSVVSSAFRTLTVESSHELVPERWRGSSRSKTIHGLVQHIVTQLSRDQAAGVVRAAVKLSMIKPATAEPFLEYRTAVTDRAIALLAPRPSPGTVHAVRTAVGVIFATLIDATLPSAGPRRLGSRQMIEALSDLTAAYLRLVRKSSGPADRETDSDDGLSKPPEPEARNGLLRPDVKEIAKPPDKTRPIRAQRGRASDAAPPPPLVNPRNAKPARPQETGPITDQHPKRRFRTL